VNNYHLARKGPFFIAAWVHRATGIYLVFMLALLSLVQLEAPYHGSALDSILAWMASVPLIFHALNGARLMLYEFYGRRDDKEMLYWVGAVSCLYLLVLAILAVSSNQSVSPFFFWLAACSLALVAACAIRARLRGLGHSLLWVLQRVTAALLLVLAPSFAMYVHLRPIGPQTGFQVAFVRGVYLLLLGSALYHAGYGLWSISADYLGSKVLRVITGAAVTLAMLAVGSAGVKILLTG